MARPKNVVHFAGVRERETRILIAGLSGHICDSCVQQAQTILEEETDLEKRLLPSRNTPS